MDKEKPMTASSDTTASRVRHERAAVSKAPQPSRGGNRSSHLTAGYSEGSVGEPHSISQPSAPPVSVTAKDRDEHSSRSLPPPSSGGRASGSQGGRGLGGSTSKASPPGAAGSHQSTLPLQPQPPPPPPQQQQQQRTSSQGSTTTTTTTTTVSKKRLSGAAHSTREDDSSLSAGRPPRHRGRTHYVTTTITSVTTTRILLPPGYAAAAAGGGTALPTAHVAKGRPEEIVSSAGSPEPGEVVVCAPALHYNISTSSHRRPSSGQGEGKRGDNHPITTTSSSSTSSERRQHSLSQPQLQQSSTSHALPRGGGEVGVALPPPSSPASVGGGSVNEWARSSKDHSSRSSGVGSKRLPHPSGTVMLSSSPDGVADVRRSERGSSEPPQPWSGTAPKGSGSSPAPLESSEDVSLSLSPATTGARSRPSRRPRRQDEEEEEEEEVLPAADPSSPKSSCPLPRVPAGGAQSRSSVPRAAKTSAGCSTNTSHHQHTHRSSDRPSLKDLGLESYFTSRSPSGNSASAPSGSHHSPSSRPSPSAGLEREAERRSSAGETKPRIIRRGSATVESCPAVG